MVFGNENSSIPEGLLTETFLIRPLSATDVELDYAAVMESKSFLRKWDQSTWPEDEFTLADNLEDLERHEREYINRQSFTFTVMNTAETDCLARWLSQAQTTPIGQTKWTEYEAIILFWIRQSQLATGLDRLLLDLLRPWFAQEWTFDGHLFFTNEQFEQQTAMFEASDLQLQFKVILPKQPRRYHAYI